MPRARSCAGHGDADREHEVESRGDFEGAGHPCCWERDGAHVPAGGGTAGPPAEHVARRCGGGDQSEGAAVRLEGGGARGGTGEIAVEGGRSGGGHVASTCSGAEYRYAHWVSQVEPRDHAEPVRGVCLVGQEAGIPARGRTISPPSEYVSTLRASLGEDGAVPCGDEVGAAEHVWEVAVDRRANIGRKALHADVANTCPGARYADADAARHEIELGGGPEFARSGGEGEHAVVAVDGAAPSPAGELGSGPSGCGEGERPARTRVAETIFASQETREATVDAHQGVRCTHATASQSRGIHAHEDLGKEGGRGIAGRCEQCDTKHDAHMECDAPERTWRERHV